MSTKDKRIKLALVGLNFGKHIIESQLLDGPGSKYIELVGICDLDAAKAKTFGGKYAVRVFESLDSILKEPEVEAVGLFTPPRGRAKLLDSIISAGKHVMTTKPFEDDPAAAMAVLKKAKKLGKVIHLNSPSPVPSDDIRQIFEWRDKYKLGQPISARWETYARYFEKADGSWMDDPGKCPVAPIFRLGIYGINDLLQLCGNPKEIHVMHSRIFTGRPTSDNAQMSIRFENGCVSSILGSFCINDGNVYPNNLIIHFEKGTVTRSILSSEFFGKTRDKVTLTLQALKGKDEKVTETVFIDRDAISGGYQWNNFHKAVRGGKLENEISPDLIVNSIRVLNAMKKDQFSNTSAMID
ncbi:MAG: hypothetical protein A2X48_00125 [Lentisphaerae bacterium GWF2_49_21]|nr:MAG: hypothetical protein A2X48_00125 [Lentisphaerae bacterium GWF2_49_21]